MGIAAIIAESLAALNAVMSWLANQHAQGKLTDDQLLSATQVLLAANDKLYAALIAALQPAAIKP